MKFDPTITFATLVGVIGILVTLILASFNGHRAFCRIETLLGVLADRFEKHEEQDTTSFQRVGDRLDQQRDMIHAVDAKVERLNPVKRSER